MDWFKAHHGIATDTRYLLIRKRTGVDCARIAGIWVALHEFASKARPRGHVAGFSIEGYAEFAGLEPAIVQAVIDAFRAQGMVVDDAIACWAENQPKTTDRTVAERVRRHRQGKQKPSTPKSSGESVTPVTAVTSEHVTAVTDETVLEEIERISISDASTQETDFHTPLGESASRAMTPGEVWSELPKLGIEIGYLKRGFHTGTVRAWREAGLTQAQLIEAGRRAAAARRKAADPSPLNIGYLGTFVAEVLAGKPARTEGGSHAAVDDVARRFAAGG